jgi:hypothetical protein
MRRSIILSAKTRNASAFAFAPVCSGVTHTGNFLNLSEPAPVRFPFKFNLKIHNPLLTAKYGDGVYITLAAHKSRFDLRFKNRTVFSAGRAAAVISVVVLVVPAGPVLGGRPQMVSIVSGHFGGR